MYENVWGSVVAFANNVIDDRQPKYPNIEIGYVDWEAHANINELPDTDLIGSTTITITEESPEMFHGSFTIGVSTYADDKNLFRLRNYVGEIFNRLRPGSKVAFYDHETLEQKGWFNIVDGTTILPVTRADARPLQFVQCQFILDPLTAVG
jgi:hypothetical protein